MSDELEDRVSIPLVEEKATLSTREVTTGKLRVRSETEVHETLARADLAGEEIEVVRVAADQPIESIPEIRTEGNVTIFPVVEEVLFVEKRLVLREEIHLIRKPTSEQAEVPVSLRRQRAVIEDVDPATGQALPRDAGDPPKD